MPTPPSTCSAPSIRSTAGPSGSTTGSAPRSTHRASWCWKRSSPKPRRAAGRARAGDRNLPRRNAAHEAVHRPDPGGRQPRPDHRPVGRKWRRRRAPPGRRGCRQAGRRARAVRGPAQHPGQHPGHRRHRPSADRRAVDDVTLNDLLGAWTNGDTGAFSTMLAGFEAKSPVAYRMLIADRNARWGQWIANRLDQPGRCSSRLAPAISPARTASSSGWPRAASPPRASASPSHILPIPASRPYRRALAHPWSSLEAWRGNENQEGMRK